MSASETAPERPPEQPGTVQKVEFGIQTAAIVKILAAAFLVWVAARRDPVEGPHFVVPTWVPIVGVLVCIGLLTQREADVWLRALALLVLGLVLWCVNLLFTRKEDRGDPAAAASA